LSSTQFEDLLKTRSGPGYHAMLCRARWCHSVVFPSIHPSVCLRVI